MIFKREVYCALSYVYCLHICTDRYFLPYSTNLKLGHSLLFVWNRPMNYFAFSISLILSLQTKKSKILFEWFFKYCTASCRCRLCSWVYTRPLSCLDSQLTHCWFSIANYYRSEPAIISCVCLSHDCRLLFQSGNHLYHRVR